jgi:hypothetical protein
LPSLTEDDLKMIQTNIKIENIEGYISERGIQAKVIDYDVFYK